MSDKREAHDGRAGTMRAVVQDAYGPPDLMKVEDVPRPVPGDDQVLVKVAAAGVDPSVWHLMSGLPYLVRFIGFGVRAPKVRVAGTAVAGRVEAVGPKVTGVRPGDEVFGSGRGTFGEYAVIRAKNCAVKPAGITIEQAAAIPVSGPTALQALRDKGGLRPGQSVLVIGAAGGVGVYAVQLAKSLGAEVTGVCSTAKVDLVRSLGADRVLDYTRDDLGDRRHDLVLDLAGNRPLSELRRVLTPRGTLVIVGGEAGGRWLGGTDRNLRAMALSPFVGQRLTALIAVDRHDDLRHLGELSAAGTITPVIDRTFPLAEAPAALRYVQEGHALGKVVLTV